MEVCALLGWTMVGLCVVALVLIVYKAVTTK